MHKIKNFQAYFGEINLLEQKRLIISFFYFWYRWNDQFKNGIWILPPFTPFNCSKIDFKWLFTFLPSVYMTQRKQWIYRVSIASINHFFQIWWYTIIEATKISIKRELNYIYVVKYKWSCYHHIFIVFTKKCFNLNSWQNRFFYSFHSQMHDAVNLTIKKTRC